MQLHAPQDKQWQCPGCGVWVGTLVSPHQMRLTEGARDNRGGARGIGYQESNLTEAFACSKGARAVYHSLAQGVHPSAQCPLGRRCTVCQALCVRHCVRHCVSGTV